MKIGMFKNQKMIFTRNDISTFEIIYVYEFVLSLFLVAMDGDIETDWNKIFLKNQIPNRISNQDWI